MKLSSVTPRLRLSITDTISFFNVKSRCNTRHEATDTVSLGTLTIYLEGVDVAQICYIMPLHMTQMLDLKQGMLELKREKQSANSPGNCAVYPTESLIEKRGATSKPTGDLQGNMTVSKNQTQRAYHHSQLAGQTKEVPPPSSRASFSDCH
jgi:hypothetical protein